MITFGEPLWRERETFADPDDGKGFITRAVEGLAGGAADQLFRDLAGGAGAVGKDLAGVPRGLMDGSAGRIARAAWDSQTFVETTTGRAAALEESYDRLIAAVKGVSGVQMQNPLRGGYRRDAELELKAELGDDYRRRTEREATLFINAGEKVFKRQLDDYMRSDPRISDAVSAAMIDFSPQMIARRADEDMRAAAADSPSLTLTLGAGLVGGVIPALRDPVNAAGLFLGGGASLARSVAGRILDVATREALINAGITAAQQPFVQAWRAEAGLEAGLEEAAKNVAFGAAFGALFGAGAQGLREVLPRAAVGEASVKEVRQAMKAAGIRPDAETNAVLKAAERAEADEALLMAGAPRAIAAEDAGEAFRAALRHAEDPVNEPPPPLPLTVAELPPRVAAARAKVTDEASPAVFGQVDIVDGKPVTFARFDPASLTTDAAAMQYKGGGDAAGVTDRLRSVTRWDPLAGGRVFVFERADGARVIADGHQRLGLARRIAAEDPTQTVELIGHVFREADGWTAADVRALAAKKNMQEGSGTALDAARILKDRPDLADGALPKGGAVVRDGLLLARLSDEAFALVNNGLVPEAYGARVGALAADPLTHAGIVADLMRVQPDSIRAADFLIGDVMRAGFTREVQADMFGELERTVSLIGERSRVFAAAVRLLAEDKRVFGTLQREADRIEGAGNVLARDDNAARAAQAAGLGDLVAKLAQRTGPVSEALNAAARAVADGEKPAKAARAFLDDMQAAIERDGLPALLADPQLRPSAPQPEPGTPQALARAELAEAELPPVRDDLTVDMFGGPRSWTLEDAYRAAPEVSRRLDEAGAAIEAELGFRFRSGGVKDRAEAEAKMARKRYTDAGQITDLARGGFELRNPADADAVVQALKARYGDVVDEGWFTTPVGYVDRKILLTDETGLRVEVQLWEPQMLAAKDAGGHALYEQARILPIDDPRRAELDRRQGEIYSAAASRWSDDWKASLGSSGSAGNLAAKTSFEITRAELPTSALSTRSQSASMTDQASPGAQSVGRSSQMQGVMETSSLDASNPIQKTEAASSGKMQAGERNLMGQLPVASRDSEGTRLVSRNEALAEGEQLGFAADLVKACKT